MQKRISNKTSTGFTLIELLVVIAIISLLVSILLPSLQSAKDLAKKMACGSNCKAIGFSIQLYTEDNDGRLPYGGRANPIPGVSTLRPWFDMLTNRYKKDSQYGLTWPDSLMCPAEEVGFGRYQDGLFLYTHYGINYWVVREGPNDTYQYLEHPDKAGRPSAVMLVFDNQKKNGPGTRWSGHSPEGEPLAFRHLDMLTILYLDGHVDWTDWVTIMDNNNWNGGILDGIENWTYPDD